MSSVWRPLRGPVLDWPLALCDSSSINPGEDLVASDVVLGKGVALENYLVHYSPRQRWWYLSKQLPSELLVFRQCDSLSRPRMHTSPMQWSEVKTDSRNSSCTCSIHESKQPKHGATKGKCRGESDCLFLNRRLDEESLKPYM
jgi:hypothetical protein